MSIYIPYFYIIEEVSTRMLYAGSKWGRDADPSNFMHENGYTTSSNDVNNIINKDGLCAFIVKKIRIFSNAEDAYNYETKFLRKINAKNNPKFYNKHNNDKITPGTAEFENIMFEQYGVKNIMQRPDFYEKWAKSFEEKYGVTNPYQLEHVKEKAINTRLKRYGERYFNSDLTKIIVNERYGVDNISQLDHVKEKKKCTTLRNYGVENPFQSEEIKERIRQKNLEKYDHDHYMKTDEGKEAYKNTCIEKYGVENFSKTKEFRHQNKQRLHLQHSRPIIERIKKYQSLYKIHFGRGWTNKNDNELGIILDSLIEEYGDIK
jgi:hypothetical protein